MTCTSGETTDSIIFPDLRIIQGRRGYRFSIDSLLLYGFAHPFLAGPLIDLGCGTGVLAFLAARLHPRILVVGLELQRAMALRAGRGSRLSGLAGRLAVVQGDIRDAPRLFRKGSFASVLSNPPYHRHGTGRQPAHDERVIARHDRCCRPAELVDAAAHLLAPGGRLFLCWPPDRLQELVRAAAARNLQPDLHLPVCSRTGAAPHLLLLRFAATPTDTVTHLPPLAVHRGHAHSPEVAGLLSTGSFPAAVLQPTCAGRGAGV
jgi:tRNA1Val (adenine37-N6)-methyltransferase